jgi:magnesium transporter
MIRSFVFSQGKLAGQDLTLDMLRLFLFDEDAQLWVDLEQATPDEAKGVLEGVFSFHALSIEDCVKVTDLSKVEEYEGYVFMVLHAVDFLSAAHEFRTNELNLFIGKNFLVTYHDKPLRSVTATIERVQKNAVAVARAPDRLTHTLIDFLLDNYEPALVDLSRDFDELENLMFTSPTADVLGRVRHLRTEVQRLRQIVAPMREVLARLARGEFKMVRAHMLPYYRDLLDRAVRISDRSNLYRDELTDTLQVHLNLQQMEINKVIKVLTVLATLSLPLLVITSFYGMNIQHMPNTEWPDWKHAYGFIFGITIVSTAVIYWFLRRMKWL